MNPLAERNEYVEEEKALKAHPARYQRGGPIYLVKEDSMSNNGMAFPTESTSRNSFPLSVTGEFGTGTEGFLGEADGDGGSSLSHKNGVSLVHDAQTVWEKPKETIDSAENTGTIDSGLRKFQKAKRRFF